jgi:hypothetical protein
VTLVDKANVLKSYAFFRALFDEVAADYPDVQAEHAYVDAMTMYLVQRPGHYDVVVAETCSATSSDLAAATVGARHGAVGDIGDHYGLFQLLPRNGPDIAGKGIANPGHHPPRRAHAGGWPARRQRRCQPWPANRGGRGRGDRRRPSHPTRRAWDDAAGDAVVAAPDAA